MSTHQANITELCKLIATATSTEELHKLLAALLSPAELETIADRWQIVCQLLAGETQRAVRDALGVGIATVERGAREIQHGNGILQKFYTRTLKGSIRC